MEHVECPTCWPTRPPFGARGIMAPHLVGRYGAHHAGGAPPVTARCCRCAIDGFERVERLEGCLPPLRQAAPAGLHLSWIESARFMDAGAAVAARGAGAARSAPALRHVPMSGVAPGARFRRG